MSKKLYPYILHLIATVWLLNGLFAKVLHLVPRHQEIVARILGQPHSETLTTLIGLSEIIMAFWIISKFRSRLCAITQMVVISVMNIIEINLADDLLLWGKTNLIFALLFICIIWYNEYFQKDQSI